MGRHKFCVVLKLYKCYKTAPLFSTAPYAFYNYNFMAMPRTRNANKKNSVLVGLELWCMKFVKKCKDRQSDICLICFLSARNKQQWQVDLLKQ